MANSLDLVQMPDASQTERKLAMATHLIGIFAPLWFPFIVWAIAKATTNPFLKAHARQAAFEGILWKAILLVLGVLSLIWTITRLVHHISTNFQQFSWEELGWKLLITVLVFAGLSLFNIVQSIFQAAAAARGQWPRREVKKALKVGGTTSLSSKP